MKTICNDAYLYLVFYSYFLLLSFFHFYRPVRGSSFLSYILFRLLTLNFSIEECLFRIVSLLYASITTARFNYKKQVHPLFIFKKAGMCNSKNYFSPK
jgi:hypothetical protein